MNLWFRKINRAWLVLALAGCLPVRGVAQESTGFAALQLPAFAKLAGLGGVNISLAYQAPGMFLYNPALLLPAEEGQLAVSYALLPAGTGLSHANYSFGLGQAGTFGAGIQYLGYGTLQGYDNTGAPTGPFRASDLAFTVSHAREAGHFRFGVNLKFAGEAISGYHSSALLADLGGLFVHPARELTVALTVRNLGWVVRRFTTASRISLPFDVQIGTTFRPEHMPVRFSLTLYRLAEWNLMLPGENTTGLNAVLDNALRHLNLGVEVLAHQNVSLLAGYNHLRRKELRSDQRGGFSGFSLGVDIRVRAFAFTYALGGYNLAGHTNTFTLIADLKELTIKK